MSSLLISFCLAPPFLLKLNFVLSKLYPISLNVNNFEVSYVP